MRLSTSALVVAATLIAGPALAQSNSGGTGASDVNPTAAGTAGVAKESGTLGTRRGGPSSGASSVGSAPGPNNPSTTGIAPSGKRDVTPTRDGDRR